MDKRIKKTRKNIQRVFMELLEEKAVNEITAQEIAELAQISRSTFYQHYTDIYHLLDQAEEEIFAEINSLLEGYPYEVIKADPLRLFTELFFYFKRNSKICAVLLNKNGGITTDQRISKMIQEKFQREWEDLLQCGDRTTARYLSQYIIAGFVGILQGWIAGGMAESEEDMALVARFFISNSVSHNDSAQTVLQKEEQLDMATLREKIGGDAKNFVGGVLGDTSGFLTEKSGEIQKRVEDGLQRASGRLLQKGEDLQAARPGSPSDVERKRQKLQKKKEELEEKLAQKAAKLIQEGKEEKLPEERAKYGEELAKIDRRLKELEERGR